MNELREIKSNTGSLSRLDKYLELPINTNMEEIVETMNIKINNLKLLQKDRHNNNPEVNKLKQILDLSNSKYRTYKLYKALANNNYVPVFGNNLNKAKNNISKYVNQMHRHL
jgi:hypothetical protein